MSFVLGVPSRIPLEGPQIVTVKSIVSGSDMDVPKIEQYRISEAGARDMFTPAVKAFQAVRGVVSVSFAKDEGIYE